MTSQRHVLARGIGVTHVGSEASRADVESSSRNGRTERTRLSDDTDTLLSEIVEGAKMRRSRNKWRRDLYNNRTGGG